MITFASECNLHFNLQFYGYKFYCRQILKGLYENTYITWFNYFGR